MKSRVQLILCHPVQHLRVDMAAHVKTAQDISCNMAKSNLNYLNSETQFY